MKISFSLAVLSFFSVTACQFNMSPASAPTASIRDLCQTIGAAKAGNATRESAETALSELMSRGTFSNSDVQNIAAGNVRIGMTEEAGLCAAGYYWYGVNETVNAGGISRQYLMGRGTYTPRWYLYTENGVVTTIQR